MIYLDHAATTPIHEDVLHHMYQLEQELYGNPSSLHEAGRRAKFYLDEARRGLANSIGTSDKEIIFTSGGTEANNLAILGTAFANQHIGKHIITSIQEHHSVLHAMKFLETKGFEVTYLPVDKTGKVNLDALTAALTEQTILVSIMMANNETGVIQPIQEIGHLLQNHDTYFHTDAVQSYGLSQINIDYYGVDLLTASAHKLNGPKGVGFLFKRDHVTLTPIQHGGQQEFKMRPGTENVVGAVGFNLARQVLQKEQEHLIERYRHYQHLFLKILQETHIQFEVNGDLEYTIPTILNLSFPGIKNDVLLTNLDLEGIAASSGSACTAGTIQPSHVLEAMYGENNERTKNALRFSFGSLNTEADIKVAAHKLSTIINRLV